MHADDFESIVRASYSSSEATMRTDTINVWDPFIRIFHWSLVGLFTLSYVTGEGEAPVHVWSGYAILVLITLRIIWGFVGTRHARFSDFVRSPAAVFRYLKGELSGNAPRTLGHNPAAGWMVLLLLVSILSTGGSGLIVLGLEGEGPLAGHIGLDGWIVTVGSALRESETHENRAYHRDEEDHEYEGDRASVRNETSTQASQPLAAAEDTWEEIHEFLANFTVLLVVLHIAGVLISSVAHRENLVRAMFSGMKRTP
jgi:cytochrome b